MTKLLLVIAALFVLNQVPARANESEDSSHVWTASEVTALQSQLEHGESAADASLATATTSHGYLYYCQAQSYVTGFWYWWQSYNLYQARYNALAACVSMNGYTCNVYCR